LGRTPAQVIIRWHLQHGVVVIPKSRNPERIRSNADVAGFELSADDMTALDGLGRAS
jgi:2,5-diketo-D-gluconate reductase A